MEDFYDIYEPAIQNTLNKTHALLDGHVNSKEAILLSGILELLALFFQFMLIRERKNGR